MPAKNPNISSEDALHLKALGARIRTRRKALALSATVAAEAAGMSRITWHRIEGGTPSVTIGAWLNAVSALGMTLDLAEEAQTTDHRQGWIPAHIRLADHPQLAKLAWHVRDVDFLSAREAFDIYERHQRHLDRDAMDEREKSLLQNLRAAFGATATGHD